MANRADNYDVIYIRRVPKAVKKAFHMLCLEKGKTIREMVIKLMERAVKKKSDELH